MKNMAFGACLVLFVLALTAFNFDQEENVASMKKIADALEKIAMVIDNRFSGVVSSDGTREDSSDKENGRYQLVFCEKCDKISIFIMDTRTGQTQLYIAHRYGNVLDSFGKISEGNKK